MVPQDLLNKESKKGIEEKKAGKMVKRENLIYETNKYVYNFHQFETTKSFDKIFLLIKDYAMLLEIKLIYYLKL